MPGTSRARLLLFAVGCLTLSDAAAAVAGARYVRAGATGTGDGSDWTNAYPQLPATLVRGTTYYVADGAYPGYTFDDAESGSELIQVLKATGSDHGTDVGWQAAYGDGRAQFGTLVFSRSYYLLDGKVGGGPPTWTTGLGFYIFTHGKGIESRTAGVSHVSVRNVEIEGHGDDGASASNDLVYLIGAHSHWTFSRLYLHDAGRTHFLWRETTDSVIEWSYMARNESTPEQHAEAISAFGGTARNVVRYSMWQDCEGTGVIMVAGSGWDIYGNVIFWTGDLQHQGTGNGSIAGWSGNVLSDTRIHNNTVVNGTGVSSGIRVFSSGGQNTAFNNLFYNCENFNAGRSGFAGVTASHSLIATASGRYAPAGPEDQVMPLDPSLFVDPFNEDYRLTRSTAAGASLTPPFDRDLLEESRGADGAWDRGAFEFVAATTLPTVSLGVGDALASEPGADAGAFVVSRSGSTSLALTVNLTTAGTATSGEDYAALPASVTIPAGSASASVALSPLDDSLVEGTETVVLTLAAGAGYTVGSPASATVSIADNDVVAGTGLTGAYFDNMDFTLPRLTRTDATVNFNWGSGSPHPSMGIDTFSVRWTGQVRAQFSQTYTFYTRSDDGVRLWVNGQLLIDKWVDQAPTEWSGTIALQAGQEYDLKLEFLENVGEALVELRWSSPSTPKQIIPTSALFPQSAPPLPAVSVTATDAAAAEAGSDPGSFSLTRTGNTSASLSVNVSWGGTATNGSDYTTQPPTVTFPAGAASAPVSVVPTDDALVEGTETVVLTVAAGVGYAVGSPASATVSIADNDVVAPGSGLTGAYFDNMDFTLPRLTRTDATVNFDWGSGSPHPSMGIDTFSVRWTGQVQAQFSQTYTFYTRSDDGVRLWVNGQLLIDKWVDQAPTEWSGTIALQASQKYDLKLEFLENVGEALVELRWSSPSTPKQIIPTSVLFPSDLSSTVVSVTATDTAASEAGGDMGSFSLTRTGNTSASLSVNVSWGGTATNGSDYTTQPATVSFPAGAASVPVSIVPTDDTVVEGTETVVLTVSAGAGYTVGSPGSATVSIGDNDAAFSPTRYVRAGATGAADGSDWVNAFPQLPPSLTRGTTYYVASGSYAGYSFDDPQQGTTSIELRKATAAEHGTDVGWQASYAVGQATFGPFTFATGFYVVDGRVGGGPESWTSGHGFKVKGTGAGQKLVRVGAGTEPSEGVSDVRLSHIELEHRGRNTETSDDGLYGFHARNVSLSHCYLHDLGRAPILMRSWANVTIDRCYIARNASSPAQHSEGISDAGSDNVIIRHNIWKDIEGTAFIVVLENGGIADNWQIYGNVFFHSAQYGVPPNAEGVSGVIDVLNDASNTNQATNWTIHNNTIVGIQGLWSGFRIDAGSNNVAFNNLWYNSVRTAHTGISLSHSWYFNTVRDGDDANVQLGTGNPFRNLSNEDLHLVAGTAPGRTLSAPFDRDMDGALRGGDGVWDRGAFEQSGAGSPDPGAPGTGLTGAYFDNVDFTVPRLTRTDATVNFDWASGSPHPSMGIDTFSVRWTGQVQAQFSQTYTFHTRSDDGVRLWVNGQLLIDRWVDQAPTEWSGTIALQAGQKYDLKLEFLENVGEALVELRWSSPSTPKQIIPTSALFPSP